MSSIYDEALAPLGVNIGQFSLLRRLGRHGPVSLTVLGRLCDLDRSTVGRNVKVLQRMGLVVVADGEDQREAMLSLSDAGAALVEAGASLWDRAQQTIEAKLGGAAQLAMLNDILAGLGGEAPPASLSPALASGRP